MDPILNPIINYFHKLGMPLNAAAHAGEIDSLIAIVHLLMLVLFVGWGTFFLYLLFRFRSSKQPKAIYEGTHNHASRYVEIAVVVIEFVLLIGFSIPIWNKHVNAFPTLDPEAEVTEVRVIAQQFAWNIHYPGPDGLFGKSKPQLINGLTNPLGLDPEDPASTDDLWTLNDLRLPVDKPVVIRLSSRDVIHSLYLPQMRVKQDIIPGTEIPVWFVPVKTTVDAENEVGTHHKNWEIACAQLCGDSHYKMVGQYQIITQSEYDEWLKELTAKKSQL